MREDFFILNVRRPRERYQPVGTKGCELRGFEQKIAKEARDGNEGEFSSY
jgi:hypothetical protein